MPASPGDGQAARPQEVFISYSRKDKEFVRRLDEELKRRDREAWVDWEGIPPGDTWEKTIYRAIESAHTFIFVLTPDSIASEVCGKEIAHAAANNKRLVPIVHHDVTADRVPKSLGELNWIFFRENDDFEEATGKLISALDTDLDWVRAHTRLLTRAIEWDANRKNNSFVLRGEDLRAAEQWLAQAGAQKERQPTSLQTEYIIASRKASARRQRITLGAVTFGLIVAIVLAVVAFFARHKAVEQETKAKNTSVQADFDLAVIYQKQLDNVDPRTLAHLARALRTSGDARLPRESLVSLLRDSAWFLAQTESMRHEGVVNAASFSPDGRRIVTASSDKTARVWDAESGKSVGESMRHEGVVNAASFSPDGRRIVTASFDKTARVWDAESGKPIGEPMYHEGGVRAASFSPDGRRIVTASDDKTARVWDAGSGKPVGEPMRHGHTVTAASFSPNGRRIVTTSWDNTARVWDADSGEPVGVPMRHESGIGAASFSPDGRWIVTASSDKTARVWDAESGKPVGEPMHHRDKLTAASFSPDGRRIVTASSDTTARVWDANRGEPVGVLMRHESGIDAASFSPDGRRIVTASSDTTARVWDAESGKPVGEPMHHQSRLTAASFSPDGRRIVTSSWDKTARVWDAESGKPIGEPIRHENLVTAASFSPDGRRIVTSSSDTTARVWDAESGKPLGESMHHGRTVTAASFSPDGRRIVTASWDETARVWDAESGKPVGEPIRHEGPVNAASFSPDGRRIVSASFDETAHMWDAESGKPVGEPMRHEGIVWTASFSPDGRRIVTISDDKTARVWDAETGKPVGEPMHHEGGMSAANFSPDGRLIVTSSTDETARVWDAESSTFVGEPLRHHGWVHVANFSPDGRRIVTASEDKTARVWDVGVDLDTPLPQWLPELAEALGEQRFNEQGLLVPPKKSVVELRRELLALKGNDFWSRLGRWFFMRGPQRTISPDSKITIGELSAQKGENKQPVTSQSEGDTALDLANQIANDTPPSTKIEPNTKQEAVSELQQYMNKQALLATTLSNIANQRHEMMKTLASNLRGGEPPQAPTPFVYNFVESLATDDLDTQLRYYADPTNYYEFGQVSKNVIRKDLKHDISAWPNRSYSMRNPPRVTADGSDFVAEFLMTYTLTNSKGTRSGILQMTLRLKPQAQTWQIVGIQKKAIQGK